MSSSDSDTNNSPSIIPSLRNFRFQTQSKSYKTSALSSSESSQSPENSQSSLNNSTTSISTVDFLNNSSSTASEIQISHKGLGKNNPVIESSSGISSSELVETNKQTIKDRAMDEYDLFCHKEKALRELLNKVPSCDIMEAQDLLRSNNWNIASAIEEAQKMKIPPLKKQKTASRGIAYVEDQETAQAQEIVLESDDEISVLQSSNENNCSNSSKINNEKKKRRRIICLDDSADEEDSSKQEGRETFSLLNYQPKSNDYLSLKAANSPAKLQESSNSGYFANNRKKPTAPKRNQPKLKESSKKRKRKRSDSNDDDDEDEYGNNDIYNSDDSEDGGGESYRVTPARSGVLTFFQDATNEELISIPGCSKKKVEAIIKYRPFVNWSDLVYKLNGDKILSGELLNGAKKVLDMRTAINRLMNKCQRISLEMGELVEVLKANKESYGEHISQQPSILNPEMQLTPYQMLGLNWLLLMHNQEVNGILADEMGLGKTAQAIAFLAYLHEQNIPGPHLIVVPSSTLDNWQNEFALWWPSATLICYHGSQESRRELRLQIINDEVEDFNAMVTTYNMVASSNEDRNFFKKLQFHYVIFDEAHMLKNMSTQRYQHLMRIKASRRLLLTGTPLQNNLVELMSLLIFVMPDMFSGKTEQIKQMFSSVCKNEDGKSEYERNKIDHAKRIMKPFVLRRLKSEVLRDLPDKHEEVRMCAMPDYQSNIYKNLVVEFTEQMKKNKESDIPNSGAGMMMQLRKAANHPLLLRRYYDDGKLLKMSKLILKEPTHIDSNADYVFEDMCVMSDFELFNLCRKFESLKSFVLEDEKILDSGKFVVLDELLSNKIENGHRILLFSQFTIMLDIVEEYLRIKSYQFLRLDGQVPVTERQDLIDEFNKNGDIPIFLLSTRAGGLGINLTSADTVLIHDIDFNPYNDKQAEDRCHRVGQKKDVVVIRMISEDTIEEGMLQRANEKLKLERDVTEANEDEEKNSSSVAKLLRDALGLSAAKS